MKDYRIGNIIEEKDYSSEWKITTVDYLESGTHNGNETIIIVNRRHLWGGEINDVETRPIPITASVDNLLKRLNEDFPDTPIIKF